MKTRVPRTACVPRLAPRHKSSTFCVFRVYRLFSYACIEKQEAVLGGNVRHTTLGNRVLPAVYAVQPQLI